MLETVARLCEVNGKLEAIIESSTNGIFEINRNCEILSANPAFLKIFGITTLNQKTRTLDELLCSEGLAADIQELFDEKTELLSSSFAIETQDKREILVHVKLLSIPYKDTCSVVGIIQDKTEVLTALKNRDYYIGILHNTINELRIDSRDTIYHLAHLVEIRDNSTGKHLERVESFVRILGNKYLEIYKNRYNWISESYIEDMAISSVLHDIGKIGISDTLLLKPGKLTAEEFEKIKEHTTIAGKALHKHEGKKDFLAMGREISYCHHERWDGLGYPNGIQGEDIPLSARIISICDVYDALVSERPYKDKIPHAEAVEIIEEESGKAFDPEIVSAFLEVQNQFRDIPDNLCNKSSK